MKFLKFVIVASLAMSSAAYAAAPPKKLDLMADKGSVQFLAVGKPSAIKIDGQGESPKGSIELNGLEAKGEITFDLKTLKTGIDLRDDHMKNKYLDVNNNPQAKLQLEKVTLPEDFEKKTEGTYKDIPFAGKLTLKGKQNPVNGTCDITRKGKEVSVEAKFKVKLTEYGVDIPKYLGITVAEEVTVNVKTATAL